MSGPQAKRPRPADEGRLSVEDEQHFGAASLLAQVISRALLLAKDEVLADAGLRAGSAERELVNLVVSSLEPAVRSFLLPALQTIVDEASASRAHGCAPLAGGGGLGGLIAVLSAAAVSSPLSPQPAPPAPPAPPHSSDASAAAAVAAAAVARQRSASSGQEHSRDLGALVLSRMPSLMLSQEAGAAAAGAPADPSPPALSLDWAAAGALVTYAQPPADAPGPGSLLAVAGSAPALVLANECASGFGSWRAVEWRGSERIHFPELFEGLSAWNLLLGEGGAALRVELRDEQGSLVTSGAAAHAALNLHLLTSAASAGRELGPYLVRKTSKGGREERLLECAAPYALHQGVCHLAGLRVKTNSSGAQNNEYRLGVSLAAFTPDEGEEQQAAQHTVAAVSRAFRVKARRAEAIRKHHPREILLDSEIWRLVHIKRDSRKVQQLRTLLAGRLADEAVLRGPTVRHLVSLFPRTQWAQMLGMADEQWAEEVLEHLDQAIANSEEQAQLDQHRQTSSGAGPGTGAQAPLLALPAPLPADQPVLNDLARCASGGSGGAAEPAPFPFQLGRTDTQSSLGGPPVVARHGSGGAAGGAGARGRQNSGLGEIFAPPHLAGSAPGVFSFSRNSSLGPAFEFHFGPEKSWEPQPASLVAAAAVAAAHAVGGGGSGGCGGVGGGASFESLHLHIDGLRQLSAAAEAVVQGPSAQQQMASVSVLT